MLSAHMFVCKFNTCSEARTVVTILKGFVILECHAIIWSHTVHKALSKLYQNFNLLNQKVILLPCPLYCIVTCVYATAHVLCTISPGVHKKLHLIMVHVVVLILVLYLFDVCVKAKCLFQRQNKIKQWQKKLYFSLTNRPDTF